jgi:phenylalanyl-tRNA synthetase beta chain
VVIGQILEIQPHPNADRLTLCKVNVGKEILSIVCGAKNIRPMDFVPVALEGAQLPGGLTIKLSKIRGEVSQGMLCSGKELGLGEDQSGILIVEGGRTDQLGHRFSEYLQLPDVAFILDVTPNRPDALSIRGVAREISALTNVPMRSWNGKVKEGTSSIEKAVEVSIKNYEACPRYMARLIRNVRVGPSPLWLKQRLERMGHRSINNVVDVTNWILLELGHPLHAFDFDLVKDSKIVVRNALEGETLLTIDGENRILQSFMLVIADSVKPIALAGVMGGKETEVSDKTKNILLECAYFSPAIIRKTSKTLGLASESSYRFERGIDLKGLPEALDKAAAMIQELAGGEILKGSCDVFEKEFSPVRVDFRPNRCRGLLGISISDQEMESIFNRLKFDLKEKKSDHWQVQVPSYRPDLKTEVDLIEEVARLWGYEKIPETAPQIQIKYEAPFPQEELVRSQAKSILQGLGLDEWITLSFLSKELLEKSHQNAEAIPLINPVRQDLSHLRTSLIPGLLEVLKTNENRGSMNVQGYEIAKCYFSTQQEAEGVKKPLEAERLGIAMMGRADGLAWKGSALEIDFFYLKGMIEELLKSLGIFGFEFHRIQHPGFHPGRCSEIRSDERVLGILGEAHPEVLNNFDLKQRVFLAELDFSALCHVMRVEDEFGSAKTFKELPRYPSISRDIALVIDQKVSHQEIERVIDDKTSNLLEEVKLFDVYEGSQVPEGKKSLAYSLTFRSSQETLKVEEVDVVERQIKERLIKKFQCQFR